METIQYDDVFISVTVYYVHDRGKLENIDRLLSELRTSNCIVSIFRGDLVISLKQILLAAISAIIAFKSKTNIARKLDIEILLRLSSETQIDEAIKKIGITREVTDIGICVLSRSKDELRNFLGKLTRLIGGSELSEEDLRTIDRIDRAVKFYNINEDEINAIQAGEMWKAVLLLILERIATVDVRR